jgi:hypothetical protein
MDYSIIALKIGNREGTAQLIQGILTEYGCLIKVRLGLHNLPADACSSLGLVLMEVVGEAKELESMLAKLNAVPDAVAKLVRL